MNNETPAIEKVSEQITTLEQELYDHREVYTRARNKLARLETELDAAKAQHTNLR